MNVFKAVAMRVEQPDAPSAGFDIDVHKLGRGQRDTITRAVNDGSLDGRYCDGVLWVSSGRKPVPAPSPRPSFNVNVSKLREGLAIAITSAVHEGWLDGHYQRGALWINRGELQDLMPHGDCTYDETDASCFIPPEACSDADDGAAIIFFLT